MKLFSKKSKYIVELSISTHKTFYHLSTWFPKLGYFGTLFISPELSVFFLYYGGKWDSFIKEMRKHWASTIFCCYSQFIMACWTIEPLYMYVLCVNRNHVIEKTNQRWPFVVKKNRCSKNDSEIRWKATVADEFASGFAGLQPSNLLKKDTVICFRVRTSCEFNC